MLHASHPAVINRLKRANGHLAKVIKLIEEGRDCLTLASQLYAVEQAVTKAKTTLIRDHIDHCLDDAVSDAHDHAKEHSHGHGHSHGDKTSAMAEFKQITQYL
jgi:DNA-binding FrmR family transcriptional regulator